MRYNLHTHTKRCHHATGEDREYVENAIQAGIQVLGFSDHCPQFFKKDNYYSFFRMKPEEVDDYVQSVLSLKKEYEKDIKIHLGFETEYYPQCFDSLLRFIKPYGFDYMILGQHFIGNEYDEVKYYDRSGERGLKFLNQYVSQVKEGIATGAFTYVAHPDIFDYNGSKKFYEAYDNKARELCRFAKEHDVPLEYNMLGYLNGRSYPSQRFWKIVAETGNKVVIGYDAHQPEALLNDNAFHECRKKLQSVGITTVDFEEIRLRNEVL